MNVSVRAFCNIVFCSIILCFGGILIDLDHLYAYARGFGDARWMHFIASSNVLVLVFFSMLFGLIGLAFAVRWNIVKIKKMKEDD